MSGFDQWFSGVSASALPVWVAGAAAALLCFVGVLAFVRSAQAGRFGAAWRVALVLVGAGLMWVVVDSFGAGHQAAARRVLDARAAELTLRAIAPGSPLACLEAVANATVEEACEKSLFANAETVAAAVAYVDARLALLGDSLDLVARDPGYAVSIERLRRSIEADRFGFVAHVLTTRGCTAENCAAFKLLRDPRRVTANLRERNFDAHVVLYAAAWRSDAPGQAQSTPSGPAVAAAPALAATTGTGLPAARFDFPSSASIPAISIMNAEPPLPPGDAEAVPQNGASAARAPAPRRQTAREAPQATQQVPQPAPAVPLPLAPPNPR
jgi:hypothetical protein